MPLADLSQVGDTTTATVDEQGTQKSVTVTVTDVSSTDTEYDLTLDVNYQSDLLVDPLTGPYHLSAVLQNDGTILWSSDATLTSGSGSLAIGTASTSSGTLTKQ